MSQIESLCLAYAVFCSSLALVLQRFFPNAGKTCRLLVLGALAVPLNSGWCLDPGFRGGVLVLSWSIYAFQSWLVSNLDREWNQRRALAALALQWHQRPLQSIRPRSRMKLCRLYGFAMVCAVALWLVPEHLGLCLVFELDGDGGVINLEAVWARLVLLRWGSSGFFIFLADEMGVHLAAALGRARRHLLRHLALVARQRLPLGLSPLPMEMATCPVCFTELPLCFFPVLHDHAEGADGKNLCEDCLRSHLIARLDDGFPLTCPVVGCGRQLQEDLTRVFKLYPVELWGIRGAQLRHSLTSETNILWCDCGQAVFGLESTDRQECGMQTGSFWQAASAWWHSWESEIPEGRFHMGRRYTCKSCRMDNCRLCGARWSTLWYSRTNLSCEQYRQGLNVITGPDGSADGEVRKCPKCRVPILKNGGCSHMTCTRCRNEFCWQCGGAWSGNHVWSFCVSTRWWETDGSSSILIPTVDSRELRRHMWSCLF